MKTLLRYITLVLLTPLWLPGMLLFAFLLWNDETRGPGTYWQAYKFVFFRPKQSNGL